MGTAKMTHAPGRWTAEGMIAHRDMEKNLLMEKKLHGNLAGIKSVFDMDQAMKPPTKELADLERATKATKQETWKLNYEILHVDTGECGAPRPETPESERPFHPDTPLEKRQEWRREEIQRETESLAEAKTTLEETRARWTAEKSCLEEAQKKWQPEKEALEATLLPVDNAIAASELKLSALLSTITISQGTVDTTVGESSECMMLLEDRFTITRTGFTVDIEQITKARESLIAALASKQAKLLELNSQVAQLSAGIEELEHLTQTNIDLNKQAKDYQDQIGNAMNSHGRREENLLLADLPCLDVEPSFDMASRELQSQLEAAKANFEKAKNSIPKKLEELKSVEAEFAAAKAAWAIKEAAMKKMISMTLEPRLKKLQQMQPNVQLIYRKEPQAECGRGWMSGLKGQIIGFGEAEEKLRLEIEQLEDQLRCFESRSITREFADLECAEIKELACARMLGLCNGRTDFVTNNSLSWAVDGSLCSNTASN